MRSLFADDVEFGGFEQLVIGEPVRARYRKSLEKPEAVEPGRVEE
ncbi:MAG TPA: hypothetical protein VHR66_10140 [Gemmataceae bacterium]|nr:hypothetical protein [Gemmataceae bacterium]